MPNRCSNLDIQCILLQQCYIIFHYSAPYCNGWEIKIENTVAKAHWKTEQSHCGIVTQETYWFIQWPHSKSVAELGLEASSLYSQTWDKTVTLETPFHIPFFSSLLPMGLPLPMLAKNF